MMGDHPFGHLVLSSAVITSGLRDRCLALCPIWRADFSMSHSVQFRDPMVR